MICDKCQSPIEAQEAHEHAGRVLCDDCYMDVLNPPKGCDPWATYTATRLKDQTLSPAGEKIMALMRERHPVRFGELMRATGLDRPSLEREMAALRHMELLTAVMLPGGEKGFGPFKDPEQVSE